MKKCTAILLALVLILSMLPSIAFAYELGSVSVLVTEPIVGEAPRFTATCNHDTYYVDTEYGIPYTDGIGWYDVDEQRYLTKSDRFTEGHSYTVSVVLAPTVGNKFALDTSVGIRTAVSGMINGKTANVSLSTNSATKVVARYTFTLSKTVSSVSVTDVVTPIAGQKPEYDALVTSDGCDLKSGTYGHYKNGVYWYDKTASATLGANDTFIEGHEYRVFLCLAADENVSFALAQNGNPAVTATVNSKSAGALKNASDNPAEIISVYYDFPTCEKAVVSSVNLTVPALQAGKSPAYTVDVSEGVTLSAINNTFTKNGICWSQAVKGYDLTPTSICMSGFRYKITIRLTPKDGFTLSKTISATVNGKSATATVSGGEVTVTAEISCPDYKIEAAGVTDVTIPAIGETPSTDMVCAEPNLYVVKSAGWYVDGNKMSETDQFIAGKNYDLQIEFAPKEDGLDKVAEFADKVSVTVNGNAVSEKKVEKLGSFVFATYTFTAAATANIGACHVTGIDAPVTGATPDYTATLPNSDTYKLSDANDKHTKNGVLWYNVTEGKTMTVGTTDNKFEAGNVYEVYVTLTPQKGYRFRTKKDGTPDVSGTINGKTIYNLMGRSEYEAILVYRFPVTEKKEQEDSGNKNESGGGNGGGGSDTPTAKNPFSDVVSSAYYYDAVLWAVENGVTSGTSATTFTPNGNCNRAQVVTFLHRMLASPEPAAIDFPFADVPIDSYYYKPVKWAVGSKITGGTSANTFSPNDNCTRAQVVTFLWRTAGQPEPNGKDNPFTDVKPDSYYYDAVLWAVENGITGGTSATTFSPDSVCTRGQVVTFLYRFINK